MVSTRSHPDTFSTPSPSKGDKSGFPRHLKTWSHAPSNLILLWLAISLPLVFWDSSYVLLRPHSMPGGYLYNPIWAPYAFYGTVDYIYGWPAYNSHNGFTAAQSTINILECVFYIWYLWIVYSSGGEASMREGKGAPGTEATGVLGRSRVVSGKMAGMATLIGFSAAIMTLSKTLLYFLNEYFSGFENIGHNSLATLVPLWIIPNGAWIVLPAYMVYVFAVKILDGLNIAAGASENAFDEKKAK